VAAVSVLFIHPILFVILAVSLFSLGLLAGIWLAQKSSLRTSPQDSIEVSLFNPDESPIARVSFEQLDEQFESELRKYLSQRVASAAQDLALEVSQKEGLSLEAVEKVFEFAEKVRLLAKDEKLLANYSELFEVVKNGLFPSEDRAISSVLAITLATISASTLATLAAGAALLACFKDLSESGLVRKKLNQIVAIHKLENRAKFAGAYSRARERILLRRFGRNQFDQCRSDLFHSKFMWFKHFEMDIAVAGNEDELTVAGSNLYYAFLAIYTDFCLCDVASEMALFAAGVTDDILRMKHARLALLHSRIAARKPSQAARILAWIAGSTQRLVDLFTMADAMRLQTSGKLRNRSWFAQFLTHIPRMPRKRQPERRDISH